MRISIILLWCVVLVLVCVSVREGDAIYPYAIKGFVRDVRLRPRLFIGTWALKKFIKLKLIKLKFGLYKTIKIKKKIKVALVLALLKKIRRRVHGLGLAGRRKRQVPDFLPYSPEELNEYYEYEDYQELPGKEPSEDEILTYLNMAKELDSQSCLPKGVCEVVAKGNGTHMNHFEKMVYDLFGDGSYPSSTRDSPTYIYEYAAYIGKSSRNVRTCEETFSSCSEQPQKLNQFMETTFTSEMCDFPDNQVYNSNSISDPFFYGDSQGASVRRQPEVYAHQNPYDYRTNQPQQRPKGTVKFESK